MIHRLTVTFDDGDQHIVGVGLDDGVPLDDTIAELKATYEDIGLEVRSVKPWSRREVNFVTEKASGHVRIWPYRQFLEYRKGHPDLEKSFTWTRGYIEKVEDEPYIHTWGQIMRLAKREM